MFGAEGEREKLIIFTEHKDTLSYLKHKICSLLGSEEAVVTIHGGLLRDERHKMESRFRQDKDVRILIATDAAGEGINLQRAHLMVNYDLPWNPNRLEQRFGRIHRIGQTEVCHLWNLVARETREGMVYSRLLEKLEQEREALSGKVFDVLGKLTFDNKSLKDLLIEAVRYNNREDVRQRLLEVVDHTLNREELKKLLTENALTENTMDIHQVMSIREDMERMEAHRLQPHFIEAFFLEAFESLNGKARPRETGRYEITSVPFAVRNRNLQIGSGAPVMPKYERICFDKALCNIPDKPLAEFITPGHPLLESVIDLIRERSTDTLKQGSIFVDENDFGTDARLLLYIEDAVQNGVTLPNGHKCEISRNLHFVELKEDGTAANAGYAPYLDYRAATDDERPVLRRFLENQQWLTGNVEDAAVNYAISEIIPAHVTEVRQRTIKRIDKIIAAVKARLFSEINYWDSKASDLKSKEAAGKINAKLNSAMAFRHADEMQARLQKRLGELELEKHISALPPVIVSGAVVIPRGLLDRLTGHSAAFTADAAARRRIERAAMEAVTKIEKALGFDPRDVSAAKTGYDIESSIPEALRGEDGFSLRFIEVKGRAKGAQTVTVTKNEVLTALNRPEQYILALVEVDGEDTHTVYLKQPFRKKPDFAAASVNYDIAELISGAETVYND